MIGYCEIPYGKKRTGAAVREQILNHIKLLEKHDKKFPFNRVVSVPTVLSWMHDFQWELHYQERINEEVENLEEEIIEFNLQQVKEKRKRSHHLNVCLTALQNIITNITVHLDVTDTELTATLVSLGYLHNNLERLHTHGVEAVNSMGDSLKTWSEVKEKLTTHYNQQLIEDKFDEQMRSIDYYFDEYAD